MSKLIVKIDYHCSSIVQRLKPIEKVTTGKPIIINDTAKSTLSYYYIYWNMVIFSYKGNATGKFGTSFFVDPILCFRLNLIVGCFFVSPITRYFYLKMG